MASGFEFLGRVVGKWPFCTIILTLALTAVLGVLGSSKLDQEWSPYDLYVPKGASTAEDREIVKDTFGYFPLMVGVPARCEIKHGHMRPCNLQPNMRAS